MFLRLTTSALALAALAAPALALTPEELWTTWTSYYARMGYAVSEGARDVAGETLTLRDVTLTQQAAPGESVTMTLPEVVMTGTGDGGVRSTFGPGMKITFAGTDSDDKPVTVKASVALDEAEIVSTGDAAAHTDRLTAPTLVATVDSVDRADEPDLTDVAALTVTGLSGESTFSDGGLSIASDSRMDKAEYRVNVAGADGTTTASGSFAGIAASGTLKAPNDAGLDFGKQMANALRAGATASGQVKLGANTHKAAFSGKDDAGGDQSGTVNVGMGGAELSVRVDDTGLGYQGAVTALDTNVTSTDMPFPVAYQIAESTFDIQVPVLKSDTPQPLKFAYSLSGVTLDEAIWTSFDPAKKLPRDPAELDIDVTGKARLTADLLDPQAAAMTGTDATDTPAQEPAPMATPAAGATPAEAPAPEATPADATPTGAPDADATAAEALAGGTDDVGNDMPFEVTELAINQIALSAAGVKLEADGALSVPDGKPMDQAVGTVKARIEGLNTLLDTLVAMGLVSQDEVTGYRMMLTMFTKAGEGGDVLTSVVEMKDGGAVIVNGQKIK